MSLAVAKSRALPTFRNTLLANIGRTPCIRLERLTKELPAGVQVFAKAELLNPGGSVKDRPALAMITDAERRGVLFKGKTILDATSGNTGIALAMIGSVLGYKVTLCLPSNASVERKRILRRYSATVIETDPARGSDGAQEEARKLFTASPQKYFYADQYNNDANWRAHYETTGPEIWEQTEGRVTHFIAGLGTSGTFTGTSRRLKEHNPRIKTISVEPNSPLHGIEGLKHMETAVVPGIYDSSLVDAKLEMQTEDAQRMMNQLAREEGLLVGPSSGANVCAALRLARTLPSGSVIVTILCDGAERYLSESYWDEVV